MSLELLRKFEENTCPCGRAHRFSAKVVSGAGVVRNLPLIVDTYRARKVYLLADKNTYAAAGRAVEELLTGAGLAVAKCVLKEERPEPDEHSVGLAAMYYPADCDAVLAVGSGVINDIGKIVAAMGNKPYIIVGTAPSMDGYASATSSMTREGLKISLPSKCADVIVGDTDILCKAPMKMMVSGLGDMLAKYVSICEWRIAHLVTGEYYCENIADLIRTAVRTCVNHAEGLLRRDPAAVQAVFEGLVIGGVAMKYAGVSRPASGVEHYRSHIWDMRGVAFGTPVELHGIQCAVGTRLAVEMYERLTAIKPSKAKALAYTKAFDYTAWSKTLRHFVGAGADSMIALEEKEGKYDLAAHEKRLKTILAHWEDIRRIVAEELPAVAELSALLQQLGAPKTMEEIGLDSADLPLTFAATKDIRDKYVLSRLCWDLGVIEEVCR